MCQTILSFHLWQMIQSGLVSMWAVRLGLFLFWRVLKAGHDSRFKRVRDNPRMFLFYWTVQGVCGVAMWTHKP